MPIPDITVNGSENTNIPINVATMGSIVAIIPALLASTLSSPRVYARNGITAVIKAVRQHKNMRAPRSGAPENLMSASHSVQAKSLKTDKTLLKSPLLKQVCN